MRKEMQPWWDLNQLQNRNHNYSIELYFKDQNWNGCSYGNLSNPPYYFQCINTCLHRTVLLFQQLQRIRVHIIFDLLLIFRHTCESKYRISFACSIYTLKGPPSLCALFWMLSKDLVTFHVLILEINWRFSLLLPEVIY